MNFKTCLQKYKDGTATLEEQQFVEQELEKFQLLSELNDEQLDDEFLSLSSSFKAPEDNFKDVKTALKKRTIKTVLLSCGTLLTAFIIFFYAIPSILNIFYYDPRKTEFKYEEVPTFINSLDVITALHLPGKSIIETNLNYSTIEHNGIGKYTISFPEMNHFNNDITYYQAYIDKNSLTLDQNFFNTSKDLTPSHFAYATYENTDLIKQTKTTLETIQTFPKTTKFEAIISFTDDLTMEELFEIYNSSDIYIDWVAIRCEEYDSQKINFEFPPPPYFLAGFLLDSSSFFTNNTVDPYPQLSLKPYLIENNLTPSILEQHFTQLIQFQVDKKAFHSLNTGASTTLPSYEFYTEALEYINQNGVMTYGMVVHATAEELVEFSTNENFAALDIRDIKLSVE